VVLRERGQELVGDHVNRFDSGDAGGGHGQVDGGGGEPVGEFVVVALDGEHVQLGPLGL
jgi:hypothetical protein